MQGIGPHLAILKAVFRRYVLWVQCLFVAVKLQLPLRYSTFPLLNFLSWQENPVQPRPLDCEQNLSSSVDVVISLYRFEKFKSILKQSLESCSHNPRVTFHFVLVCGTQSEIRWLTDFVGKTHHKLHLSENRIGIYEAWNIAVKSGSSDFITNLNADDIRLPHSICRHAAALENEEADGSYGNFILSRNILDHFYLSGNRQLVSNLGAFNEDVLLLDSQNLMHCAPIWKRELHKRVGLFDESLNSSGDTEFWLRAMSHGAKFISYPPVTAIYFHNPEGLSSSISSTGRKEWSQIRRKFLDERFHIEAHPTGN